MQHSMSCKYMSNVNEENVFKTNSLQDSPNKKQNRELMCISTIPQKLVQINIDKSQNFDIVEK